MRAFSGLRSFGLAASFGVRLYSSYLMRDDWSYIRGGVGTVQYSTVQYSTVQCSAVQYSTVQYSAVQYSAVRRHSTAVYINSKLPV